MNKVFNINLGGIVFTIDELAFDKLNRYLNKLKAHFANTQGSADIIADIEARMAELLRQKLSDPKEVVSEKMVDETIAVMGDVNQLDEENGIGTNEGQSANEFSGERKLRRDMNNKVLGGVCSGLANYLAIDPTLVRILFLIAFFVFGSGGLLYIILWIVMQPSAETDQPVSNFQDRKHLFRDPDDKVLGGVCSGIANYISLDPVWVRLFFALAFFGFGFGFLIYIVLWVVVPKAITPTQKLQMKGNPIDVSNIEREVKNTFSKAKENAPKVANEVRSFAGNAAHSIAEIAGALIKLFGKIFAFVLLFLGISGMILLIIVYFGMSKAAYMKEFLNMCVANETVLMALKFGVLLLISATLFSFIISAFRLLFNLKFKKSPVYSVLGVISFVGLVLLIYGGIEYGRSVKTKATYSQRIGIAKHDTLYLVTSKRESDSEHILIMDEDGDMPFNIHVNIADEGILQETGKLKIKKSFTDSSFLELRRTSRGYNSPDALKFAEKFQYNVQSRDSSITFDQGIFIPKNEKWKYPDVKMILNIPVGTVLKIDEGVLKMINRNSKDYFGKTFMMTEKGLKCLDCSNVKWNEDDDEMDEKKDIKIDWTMDSEGDSTDSDIHIITKNKKVIIKNGKKIEVEEKRIGPFHIKIEKHVHDD